MKSVAPLKRFALLSAAVIAFATSVQATPELPKIPETVFDVKKYGAVGDGVATETAAIQSAIDAASKAGGGIVEIPAGTFLCGPLHFASQINLHIDSGALLRMLPLDKFPGGTRTPESLINGNSLHDVAITGSGGIDGQGAPWWPFARDRNARRPCMIRLGSCERVLVEGVHLTNSPMFHIAIGGKSLNVTVRGVTIRANPSTDPVNPGHNTDACDVSGSHILVQDCDVSVGDDNFTCGGNTSDVLITNCTYGFGHGVSIGSFTSGGVSNITVVNCTFNNTEQGIRIKTDRGRGGFVHNLSYYNLHMTNVEFPILIYASYMATNREYRALAKVTPAIAATYPSAPIAPRTPFYRDITFSNITATVAPGNRAGLIWGLPEAAVTNVVLDHVTITADKPFGIFDAQNVRLVDTRIITPEGINKLASTNAQISITGQ
jgi:polygalacturonase